MDLYLVWITKVDHDGCDDQYYDSDADELVVDRVYGVFDDLDVVQKHRNTLHGQEGIVWHWVQLIQLNTKIEGE